MVEVKAYLCSE